MSIYMVVPDINEKVFFIINTRNLPVLNRNLETLESIALAQTNNYDSAHQIIMALNNFHILNEHLNSLENLKTLLKGCLEIKTNSANVTLMLQSNIIESIISNLENPYWFKINELRTS